MLLVGLISDTHGLLRPEALVALAGSDLLLHAGDVGGPDRGPDILTRLQELAPVYAVRGNVDRGGWAAELPVKRTLDLEGVRLLLHHGHLSLSQEKLASADVVVQGHSHRPEVRSRAGVLLVNPGSAGPRRFRLPVTVARLRIDGRQAEAELVQLG
jgi:putative phosphoesterase